MNRPCPIVIPCPPDTPLGNFSSEAPDPFLFTRFHWPVFDPRNPIGGGRPPVPPVYFAGDCAGICTSTLSQADADLCAARQGYICEHTPPGGRQPTFFFNTQQVCSIDCGNGSTFFWVVPNGQFAGMTQAEADQRAFTYACNQVALHFFCLSDIPNEADVGVFYSATIFVQEGAPRQPVIFNLVAGSLPPGLSLVPEGPLSIVLRGTPTTNGTFTFTIQATDAQAIFVQKTYTIQVCSITPATLPDGTVGTAYSQQLVLPGAVGAVTFALVSGTLPDGLTLSAAGLISGTPTTVQNSSFTVSAADSIGQTCISSKTLNVVVGCDASTDWINSPGTCRLRIKAYVDGTFINNLGCPAYDAGAGVVWDGTFKNFVQIVPNTSCRYDIVGQGFGQISGFAIDTSLQFLLRFSAGSWLLQVSALRGGVPQPLWTSNNKAGTNPLGTYTFFNGCGNIPASLIVEGF